MSLLHHIGISGGKDSTALLLWSIHKSGLPRESLRVTFCDTGNEDPMTYAHLDKIESEIIEPAGILGGLETLIPPLQFFPLALKKGRFPSRKAQFCTVDLKVEPTRIWLRKRWDEGHEVVMLNGKRAGESHSRKKAMKNKPERGFSDYWGCEDWAPIAKWTIDDVLAIHREFGFPLNPLYDLGASRVGCWPCINCGKKEIRLVAQHRPEKIDEIERWESEIKRANGGISPFFPPRMTTKRYRTVTVTTKNGEQVALAPIREVVRWAQTERGGEQIRLPLEEPKACFAKHLSCE